MLIPPFGEREVRMDFLLVIARRPQADAAISFFFSPLVGEIRVRG